MESLNNSELNNITKKKLPSFFIPQSFGCIMVENYLYYVIKAVKETDKTIIENKKSRPDLIYNNLNDNSETSCFLKICFNTFGTIEEIVYFGKLKVEYTSLIALIGLHETYLNYLFEKNEINLITDIPNFLNENWALALYHDSFSHLIMRLKNIIITDSEYTKEIKKIISLIENNNNVLDRSFLSNILKDIDINLKNKIEKEIVEYLKDNENQMPFYYIDKN